MTDLNIINRCIKHWKESLIQTEECRKACLANIGVHSLSEKRVNEIYDEAKERAKVKLAYWRKEKELKEAKQ